MYSITKLIVLSTIVIEAIASDVRLTNLNKYYNTTLPDSWHWNHSLLFDDSHTSNVLPRLHSKFTKFNTSTLNANQNKSIRTRLDKANETWLNSFAPLSYRDHLAAATQNFSIAQQLGSDVAKNQTSASSNPSTDLPNEMMKNSNQDSEDENMSSIANPIPSVQGEPNQPLKLEPHTQSQHEHSKQFQQNFAHFSSNFAQFHADSGLKFAGNPSLKPALMRPPSHNPNTRGYPQHSPTYDNGKPHSFGGPKLSFVPKHGIPKGPVGPNPMSGKSHPGPEPHSFHIPAPVIYQCCKYVFPADLMHDHLIYMLRQNVHNQPSIDSSMSDDPNFEFKSNIRQVPNQLDSDEGEREEPSKGAKLQESPDHASSTKSADIQSEATFVRSKYLRPENPINYGSCVPIYQMPTTSEPWNFRSHPIVSTNKPFLFNFFRKPFLG